MLFGKIQGVDISRWNDVYDINLLASKCDFVYMKCSQGINYTDPKFKERYAALKGKTYRGIYSFLDYTLKHYIKGKEFEFGAAQADYVYNLVKDDMPELPIWIDVENNEDKDAAWEKITVGLFGSISRITKIQMGFYQRWYELTGLIAGTYTRKEFADYMQNFNKGILSVAVYPYALMNSNGFIYDFLGKSPISYIGKWNNWTFWQYSSSGNGKSIGINGNVDLDVFNGTEEEWSKFVGNNLPTSDPIETEDPEPIPDIVGKKAITLQSVNIRKSLGTSGEYLMVAPKDSYLDILEYGIDTLGNKWIRCGYKEWACVNFNGMPLLEIK